MPLKLYNPFLLGETKGPSLATQSRTGEMGSRISPLTKEVGTGRPCSSGLFPLPLPIHLAGSPPPPALAAFAAPPVGASGLVVSGERGWQRKSLAASSVGRGQRWQQGTLERVGGSPPG